MVNKKSDQQMIIQALNAAETNVRLAKKLLSGSAGRPSKPSTKNLPGITGTFDGENMVTKEGKKYPVNPNYASKSVLVYGDTLKRVEINGKERFKQIKRVKRQKVEGILAKKSGKIVVVTPDGSYKVLEAAISFYKGEEGDEAVVVLPQKDKTAPFAAIESIEKKKSSKPSKPSSEKKLKKKTDKKAVSSRPAKKKSPTKKKTPVKKKEPSEKKAPVKEKTSRPAPKKYGAGTPIEGDEELR